MKIMWLALALSISTAASAKVSIECPETIETEEKVLNQKDWNFIPATKLMKKEFVNFSIFDGHPDEKDFLMHVSKPNKPAYWKANSEKGLWISCNYTNSTHVLARQAAEKSKKCTMVNRKKIECE